MSNNERQQVDNYRLIRQLGAGQFGEVYLAEHIHARMQAQVAVKILRPLARNGQRDLLKFLKEVRLSRLEHPHIVQVRDFGIEGDIPFIVMEYAPNGTLRERHPKGTQVPLPTVVSYVQQVASALQYIHDKRFIHRDIKPANMLIGEHDQILLSDFGIATISHSTVSRSQVELAGTVVYMSPEQINGHPYPASDQYALGVAVYEWLCGSSPFQGTIVEIMQKHQVESPPPLREKIPTIAPDVEQVVMKALEKDPKQRFARVQEFAHALEMVSSSKEKITPLPSTSLLSERSTALVAESTSLLNPSQPLEGISVKESGKEVIVSRISRRRVVLGGAIAGLGVATASFVWLRAKNSTPPPSYAHPISSSNSTHHATPTSSPTPTPTHVSLGTVLSTYAGHSGYVNTLAWAPDGTRIASGSDDATVQVWRAADGSLIFPYKNHTDLVEAVAWSPDGKRLASGSWDRTVQVYDAVNGDFAYEYMGTSGFVDTVAWSPDGKRLASGSYDAKVQMRNAIDGTLIFVYPDHADVVSMVAWSPDSKHVASASYDGTVKVWDAIDNGRLLLTYKGHASRVHAVAWSPDGRHIASSGEDGTVQVWDAISSNLVFAYKGHSGIVNTVSWSPDSKRIASGGVDTTVQIWDAFSREHSFTYQEHSAEVRVVAWSRDGTRVASGSSDNTVKILGAG